MSVKGRVRKFGDNIDTDGITPAARLHLDIAELKLHAFEPIVKEFYKTVRDGDVIVAGVFRSISPYRSGLANSLSSSDEPAFVFRIPFYT